MLDYTEEEIAALKGSEFSYEFSEKNGQYLDGKSTYAYVAQADINKGITIMGTLPAGTANALGAEEGVDVILSCCKFSLNNTDAENNALMKHYVDNVRSGVFNTPFVTAEGNAGQDSGGNASHMKMSCVF